MIHQTAILEGNGRRCETRREALPRAQAKSCEVGEKLS